MSFAKKLQKLRQNRELSQENLAEILNVSRQSVSKWERGKGYPEMDKLIFLSDYFDVSLDELLKDSYPASESRIDRRPINLTKPSEENPKESSSIRKAYPETVSEEEIYPEAGQQRSRIITAQNVDIAKYGNYSCAPQSSYSSQSIGIPRKRRKLKMSRILFALVMLIGAIIISLIMTMIAMPDHFFPEENTPIYYDHDVTSVNLSDYPVYNIKCCIDKATDIRYIFNTDSDDGIATVLYQEEFDTYIELVDVLSNEPVYCYPSYPDENITVIIDDNKYVIPPYMTEYSITTYEIENYVVASDDDGNKYFIPKYIFEKFEFLTFSETPESEISAEVIEVTVLPEIMNP